MEGITHTQQSATNAAVSQQAKSREGEQTQSRLTPMEKVAFGVAGVFTAVVLVILLALTVIGFIFSPAADTLVFALLMLATGTTSWVIWRGGKRNAA